LVAYEHAAQLLERLNKHLNTFIGLPPNDPDLQDLIVQIDDVALTLAQQRYMLKSYIDPRNNSYANHESHHRDIASALRWANVRTIDEAYASLSQAIKKLDLEV
jgi:hypothetical protein